MQRSDASGAATRRAPFSLTDALNRPGGDAVPILVAPWIVRTSARGACSMRRQSKEWKLHVDAEILIFMREFNQRFKATYPASYRNMGMLRPSMRPSYNSDAVAAAIRQWDHDQAAIDKFTNAYAPVFGEAAVRGLFKKVQIAMQSDDNASAFPAANALYRVGEETVHFYSCFALNGCEVHGPRGEACCVPPEMTLVPFSSASNRLLHAAPSCVFGMCAVLNVMSGNPLEAAQSKGLRSARQNNAFLEGMLRHAGATLPCTSHVLASRMGDATYNELVEKNPGDERATAPVTARPRNDDGSGSDSGIEDPPAFGNMGNSIDPVLRRVAERCNRQVMLRPHPALPEAKTMQGMLRIPDACVALAQGDVLREEMHAAELEKATRAAATAKLMGDVDALLAAVPGSETWECRTLTAIDAVCLGTKATICRILGLDAMHNAPSPRPRKPPKHPLDVPFIRTAINVIAYTMSSLRSMDAALMGGLRASADAYAFVTGLVSGNIPQIDLAEISSKLNCDASGMDDGSGATLEAHRAIVMAMHAFDALQWDGVGISKRKPAAGSSTDPIDTATGSGLKWTVTIGIEGQGGVRVSGNVDPPKRRAQWVQIRASCVQRLDDLDLEVENGLPHPPAQARIDELYKADGAAREAISWLTTVAQTMAYHAATRAQALDVLTVGGPKLEPARGQCAPDCGGRPRACSRCAMRRITARADSSTPSAPRASKSTACRRKWSPSAQMRRRACE